MVRRYDKARSVGRGDVNALIRAGLTAPSAGFSQGSHFLVLDQDGARERFWSVTTHPGVADDWLIGMQTAPVVIVVYSDRAAYEQRYRAPDKAAGSDPADLDRRWPVPYWHVDAGMAAMLVQLAAVDRGLACCFFAVPTDRVAPLGAAFAVPPGMVPVGVVSVGYPDPSAPRRGRRVHRRDVAEMVSYQRFGGVEDIHEAPDESPGR